MKHSLPRYINKPGQILWFETDEFIVIIVTLFFAYLLGNPIFFALSGFSYYFYKDAKKKNPRGFFVHLPYKLGLKNFKGFPHTFVKKFIE